MAMPDQHAHDVEAVLTPAAEENAKAWPAGPPSPAPAPPSAPQDSVPPAAAWRADDTDTAVVRVSSLPTELVGRPERPSQVHDGPSAAGGAVLWRVEEDSSLLVSFDGDYNKALYFRYDEDANTATPVAVTAAADGGAPPPHGSLKLSGFYKELDDDSMVPASLDEYVAYFAAVARYVPGAALPPRVLVTLLCGEASMLFTYKQDKGITLKGTVLFNEGGELSELTPTQFELRKGGISCRNWRKSFNVQGCFRVAKGAGGGAVVALGVACMRDMAEYLEAVLDINNTQRKRPRANGRVSEVSLPAAQQALGNPQPQPGPQSRPPYMAPPEKRPRRAAAVASSPPPAPDLSTLSDAEILTDEDYVPAPARGGGAVQPQRAPWALRVAPAQDPRRLLPARSAGPAAATMAGPHPVYGYVEEAYAQKANSSRGIYGPSFPPDTGGGAWAPPRSGFIPQGVVQPRDPALSRCEAQAIQLILASTSGECTKQAVQGILRHVVRYHSPAAPGRRVSWALADEGEEEEDDGGRAAHGRGVSFSPPAAAPSPPLPASLPRAPLPLVRQKWRSQLRMQQGDEERQAAEAAAAQEGAAAAAAAGGEVPGAVAMEEDTEAAAAAAAENTKQRDDGGEASGGVLE